MSSYIFTKNQTNWYETIIVPCQEHKTAKKLAWWWKGVYVTLDCLFTTKGTLLVWIPVFSNPKSKYPKGSHHCNKNASSQKVSERELETLPKCGDHFHYWYFNQCDIHFRGLWDRYLYVLWRYAWWLLIVIRPKLWVLLKVYTKLAQFVIVSCRQPILNISPTLTLNQPLTSHLCGLH